MLELRQYQVRIGGDLSQYDQAIAGAALLTQRLDSSINELVSRLTALTGAGTRAGQSQREAGNAAQQFVAALQRQLTGLREQSGAVGKSEADLQRLKAAELDVAAATDQTIQAIERESRALNQRQQGQRIIDNARALREEKEALEAGIAVDSRAARAKSDLIRELDREIAALGRLNAVRATGRPGVQATALEERAARVVGTDEDLAAAVQPRLTQIATARQVQDNAAFIAALERTSQAAGRTRAEILQLEAAQRGLSAQAAPLIARIASVDRGFQSFNKTGRLTALELQQIGFQLNDFAVQVASGQNVLTAFIQQGSQLSGTFGGAGNAFRALTSLLTPLRVALLGVGAAAGVFAIAAAKTEEWRRSLGDIQAALAGTGRGGLLSNSQLSVLIEQIAQAPGVTRDAATQAVAELSRVNEIGADLFAGLARIAADYARITGTDVPTATKTLAQAFAAPAQGAKTLDGVLGTLSSTTLLTVERLANIGDVVGAQKALFAGVEEATRGLATNGLTPLQQATNEMGNAWDRLMGTMRESKGLAEAADGVAKLLDGIRNLAGQLPEAQTRFQRAFGATAAALPITGIAAAEHFFNRRAAPEPLPTGDFARRDRATVSSAVAAAVQQASGLTREQDEQIKSALKLGEAYKSTAQRIDELVAKQGRLKDALRTATQAGATEQAQVLRSQISGITEQIDSLRKKGAGDPDRTLRRETQDAIRLTQRILETERAQVEQQQQDLRTDFEAGIITLRDYYAQRGELVERGTAAVTKAIDAEVAAFERQRKQARTPEVREEATARLAEAAEKQEGAAAKAGADRARLVRENQRDELTLGRALIDQEAELASLRGEDARAEAIRNQQRIVEFARVNQQAGGPQQRVAQFATLIQQQTTFNNLQRDVSIFTERAQIAEEHWLITAEQRGLSLEETERGLHEQRQQALSDLGALVAKVEALAKAGDDPRIKLFAEQLSLQFRRAAEEADPQLKRLKGVADDAGRIIAEGFAKATTEGGNLRDVLRDIEKQLVALITQEVVTRPLADSISKAIKGGFTPGGGGLFEQLGASASKALGGLFGGGGGGTATPTTGDFARLDRGQASAGGGLLDSIGGFLGGLFPVGNIGRFITGTTGGTLDQFGQIAGGGAAQAAGQAAQTAAITAAITAASTTETTALTTAITTSAISTATTITAAISASTAAIVAAITAQGAASAVGGGLGRFLGIGASPFHTGGIAGTAPATRTLPAAVYAHAPRFHAGGIPGLAPDEVPAILLGGPKGRREEVLTADDPRHADNGGLLLARMADAIGVPRETSAIDSFLSIAAAAGAGAIPDSPIRLLSGVPLAAAAARTGGSTDLRGSGTRAGALVDGILVRERFGAAADAPEASTRLLLDLPRFHAGGIVGSNNLPTALARREQPLAHDDLRSAFQRGGRGDVRIDAPMTIQVQGAVDHRTAGQIARAARLAIMDATRNL